MDEETHTTTHDPHIPAEYPIQISVITRHSKPGDVGYTDPGSCGWWVGEVALSSAISILERKVIYTTPVTDSEPVAAVTAWRAWAHLHGGAVTMRLVQGLEGADKEDQPDDNPRDPDAGEDMGGSGDPLPKEPVQP